MKTIGIIGGLGPETTAEFYLGMSQQLQSAAATARPHILISSVPINLEAEASAIRENKGLLDLLPMLVTEAKRLEAAGADFLVMPCNSLHVHISALRASVDIPILSIIEETARFLRQSNSKKVGIISTNITQRQNLYSNILIGCGVDSIEPNELQQAMMGKIIHNLVNGMKGNQDRKLLMEIIDDFVGQGADTAILACTDLQMLLPMHPHIQIFDTMDILLQSAVAKMR